MPSALTHVYCYQIGSDNCFKVGHTKSLPEKRMRGWATGSPRKPGPYRDVSTEDALALERYIHQLLDAKRAENGEFFYVTPQELDDAVDQAVAFMKECQPLFREVKKLSRKKPNSSIVDPPDEMTEVYRQLREANRDRFLLDRRIELLESKVQVLIGENLGMRGIASWKWVDRWTMDIKRFKKEQEKLYEKYKRDSGGRRFCLAKVDLTRCNQTRDVDVDGG
jgi:Meiotically up-regulated gene 113